MGGGPKPTTTPQSSQPSSGQPKVEPTTTSTTNMNSHTTNASLPKTPAQDNSESVAVVCVIFVLLCTCCFGVVVIVIYSKVSTPYDPEFQVHSIYVSPFNTSGPQIGANWNISLSVVNTNMDVPLSCENIVLQVLHGEDHLSVAGMKPFYLRPRHQGLMQASFGSVPATMDNWVETILGKGTTPGTLSVKMQSRIKYNPGTEEEKKYCMRVSCEHLKIDIPWRCVADIPLRCSADAVSAGPASCTVSVAAKNCRYFE